MIDLLIACGSLFGIGSVLVGFCTLGDELDRRRQQRVDARMALYPTTGRDVQATPRTQPTREVA